MERGKAACRAKGDVGLTYRIADEATRAREANARPKWCCSAAWATSMTQTAPTPGPSTVVRIWRSISITYRVELDARTGRGQSSAAPRPLFLRTYYGLGGKATNTQNTTPVPVDQMRNASSTRVWERAARTGYERAIAAVSGDCDRRVLASGS